MMSRCASLAVASAIGAPTLAWAGNGQLRGSGWEEPANASLDNITGLMVTREQAMATSNAWAGSPYILQAGYSCPPGYQHLDSSEECQYAAKQIVPNGISLAVDRNTPSSSWNPKYCYVYGDSASGFPHLYWNPDGVTSGSWTQRNVICKKTSSSNGVMIKWSHDQNYCLSVDNNDAARGVKMQLWNCAGGAGQYFDLPPAGQLDYVKLHMNPSHCLVVDGNHNSNGARTQVWSPCSQYNQKWTLAPQGSNAHAPEYTFQWALGGKCLVVDGNRAFNGAKVNIWDCARVPSYYKTWVAVGA